MEVYIAIESGPFISVFKVDLPIEDGFYFSVANW